MSRSKIALLLVALAVYYLVIETHSPHTNHPLMHSEIDFGVDMFERTVASFKPDVDYGPQGETKEAPWTDEPAFQKWLTVNQITGTEQQFFLRHVPRVSLSMNHGSLLGIRSFMKENSDNHQLTKAGFVIIGTGPNGDYIVVDLSEGRGQAGWLPMAMIGGKSAEEVRKHFIPTNPSLGDFIRASEQEWKTVPKDWYDARSRRR